MIYAVKNELNKSFLSVVAGEVVTDYRFKMIKENTIDGLLPVEERNINGEVYLYFDITEKINLVKFIMSKNITMNETRDLFGAIKCISDKLEEFFMDEACLLFEPDLIFFNPNTGSFEFLCIPGYYELNGEPREDIVEMFQLIIGHIEGGTDEENDDLFELYEKVSRAPMNAGSLFENFWKDKTPEPMEIPQNEPELLEEEDDEPVKKGRNFLSYKVIIALSMAAGSLILVGLGLYYSFMSAV